jgi:hypothetical protein
MRLTLWLAPLLLLCGLMDSRGQTPANNEANPQIVRVSYVQGEVKLSVGKNGDPYLGKVWVAADVNSPIEEGATLATEQGRAEVEFEDGSMVYLAEHSVLQFIELTSDSVRTHTDIGLLTGRATIAHESGGHSDFTLEIVGSALHSSTALTLRVESALNGAMCRLLEGSIENPESRDGEKLALKAGDDFRLAYGAVSRADNSHDDPGQKAWDQWVSEQRTARKADIEKGLKESGLTAPIPGLVDLVRGGTFIDCPPYGKCWEPKEGAFNGNLEPEEAEESEEAGPKGRKASVERESTQSPGLAGNATSAASVSTDKNAWLIYRYYDCPFIYLGGRLMRFTTRHPHGVVVRTSVPELIGVGWWATCYAGSWVPVERPLRPRTLYKRGKHPRHSLPPVKHWVVGPKSRNGSFLRVRLGKGIGFIPRHPLDTKGKPPLNAKDGVLVFHQVRGTEVAEVKTATRSLQIETYRPGGYEQNWTKHMPKVERPVIEARVLTYRPWNIMAWAPGNQKNPLTTRYDYKTGDFVAPTNGVWEGRGHGQLEVIAHFGQHYEGGGSPSWDGSGRSSGTSGSRRNSASGGKGGWHGSSHSHLGGGAGGASHGYSGGGGGSHSSSGGGSGSHSFSGGGGGSHSSSSGGGGSVGSGGAGGVSSSGSAPASSSGRPH